MTKEPKKLKFITLDDLEKNGWPKDVLPPSWRSNSIFIEVKKNGEPRYDHGKVYTAPELKELESIKII